MMNIPYRYYQSSYHITSCNKADLDIIGMFMYLILWLIRAAIYIKTLWGQKYIKEKIYCSKILWYVKKKKKTITVMYKILFTTEQQHLFILMVAKTSKYSSI